MVLQWARWARSGLARHLPRFRVACDPADPRAFSPPHAIEAAWIRPLGISVLLAHPYLLMRVVVALPACVANHPARGHRRACLCRCLSPGWRSGRCAPPGSSSLRSCISSGCSGMSPGRFGRARARQAALPTGACSTRGLALCCSRSCSFLLSSWRYGPSRARSRHRWFPLAALGAALNYYFAFAPPAWLRRMWQSSELYGLLSDRAVAGGAPSRSDVLNRLSTFAVSAVGATGGSAALWDDSRQALITDVSRWGYLEPGRPVPEGSLLDAWRSNRATLVQQHEWVLPGGSAGSVYVVPIPCEVGPRGLLFVDSAASRAVRVRRSRAARRCVQ